MTTTLNGASMPLPMPKPAESAEAWLRRQFPLMPVATRHRMAQGLQLVIAAYATHMRDRAVMAVLEEDEATEEPDAEDRALLDVTEKIVLVRGTIRQAKLSIAERIKALPVASR